MPLPAVIDRSRPRARRTASRGVVVALVALVVVGAACGNDVQTTAPATSLATRGTGTAPPPTLEAPGSVPGTSAGTAPGTTAAPPTTSTAAPTTSKPPATATTSSAPAAPPAGARDLPVATTTVPLVDTSRPTVSRGRQIAATRTLTTTVVYPSSGGPYPLVVFAHGFQLGPSNYTQIMRAIAAGGYVVAAPSFPLADAAVAGANLDRGDIPNQAGDLSFVLTQLTGGGAPAALAGKIDGQRLGAVGHSDGADTVLLLGYDPAHVDGRVRAVAALSPDAMTGAGGTVGTAPLLITHGDRDSIVPYSNSVTVFGQVHAHRFLVTLLGGDHLPPVQGAAPWAPVLDRAILDLLDHDVAGRTAGDDALVADGATPGVTSIRQAG